MPPYLFRQSRVWPCVEGRGSVVGGKTSVSVVSSVVDWLVALGERFLDGEVVSLDGVTGVGDRIRSSGTGLVEEGTLKTTTLTFSSRWTPTSVPLYFTPSLGPEH